MSEFQIKTDPKNKRKHIKPDISIHDKNDNLLAAIEIKVSNGFKRKSIMEHLRERERKLTIFFPDVFFGVIAYWNFFDTNSDNWNSKHIGIKWYNEKGNHSKTGVCVKNLILLIEKYLTSINQ